MSKYHDQNAAERRAELARTREMEDEVVRSSGGTGETFASVFQRRLSRRGLLKSSAAAAAMVMTAPALDAVEGSAQTAEMAPVSGPIPEPGVRFQPIAPQPASIQSIALAEGYGQAVLVAWGDPVIPGAPDFNPDSLTADAQAMQFGYNCDYIGFHALPWGSDISDGGLLWVNHEYTNEEIMFAGYDPESPTEEQVNIGIQAHGGSVVELRRDIHGRMWADGNSSFNRRITGTTPIRLSGPAAEHDWVQTSADEYGQTVLGTFNNCAGGITPWGTILTCEENFHQYFANAANLSEDDPRFAVHDRYGLSEEASGRKWERYHGRFDIGLEPNEPFRFGWVVELDPYEPGTTPVKRTALGRFRHEGATFGYSPSGRVAFYSGDDSQFEYIYKYVSDNAYDPLKRGMNQDVLEVGTLYVAKLNDDDSGEWLPLIYGEGALTEENGFGSQGDVLIKTRLAADLLGATKMDRPEDIQQNPVNKKVYIALTNNTSREADQTNPANPRANNEFGHIIELTEENDDAASTAFSWDIFILCGMPDDESTYYAGYPKETVSPVAAPDNVNFDLAGNLWISTDGQGDLPGELADALHCVPTEGPQRGNLQQFLSVVAGAECASFEFVNDNRNLFVSIQHPGQGGTYEDPVTLWPNSSSVARPSVIQVWAEDGGRINE